LLSPPLRAASASSALSQANSSCVKIGSWKKREVASPCFVQTGVSSKSSESGAVTWLNRIPWGGMTGARNSPQPVAPSSAAQFP